MLRIELDEVTPTVWCRILVPTRVRMSRLHDMIQAAMGWTNSHLHAFTVGDARYGMCFDEHPEDEIDEQTVTVLQALRGQKRFTYEYDFGDRWHSWRSLASSGLEPGQAAGYSLLRIAAPGRCPVCRRTFLNVRLVARRHTNSTRKLVARVAPSAIAEDGAMTAMM